MLDNRPFDKLSDSEVNSAFVLLLPFTVGFIVSFQMKTRACFEMVL